MEDIVIRELSKSFGDKKVLERFSAVIPAGKTTCIEGPSGCGKTTLLRILSGLESPDSGEVLRVPEKIGWVFQEDRLCEDFSPVSNVRLVTGKSVPEEVIRRHLSELSLGDSLRQPVRELSGGMKRRVSIARAVLYGGELLILDEPFKGLDVTLRLRVMDYVRKYTEGKTVVLVTHDPGEAAFFGNTVLFMEKKEQETER